MIASHLVVPNIGSEFSNIVQDFSDIQRWENMLPDHWLDELISSSMRQVSTNWRREMEERIRRRVQKKNREVEVIVEERNDSCGVHRSTQSPKRCCRTIWDRRNIYERLSSSSDPIPWWRWKSRQNTMGKQSNASHSQHTSTVLFLIGQWQYGRFLGPKMVHEGFHCESCGHGCLLLPDPQLEN
jgi:hypothetical protein